MPSDGGTSGDSSGYGGSSSSYSGVTGGYSGGYGGSGSSTQSVSSASPDTGYNPNASPSSDTGLNARLEVTKTPSIDSVLGYAGGAMQMMAGGPLGFLSGISSISKAAKLPTTGGFSVVSNGYTGYDSFSQSNLLGVGVSGANRAVLDTVKNANNFSVPSYGLFDSVSGDAIGGTGVVVSGQSDTSETPQAGEGSSGAAGGSVVVAGGKDSTLTMLVGVLTIGSILYQFWG